MVLGVLVRRLQTLKNVLTQRPPSAQPILVARFLMNLREADANQAGAKLMQSSKCSALEFRRRRRSISVSRGVSSSPTHHPPPIAIIAASILATLAAAIPNLRAVVRVITRRCPSFTWFPRLSP